MTSKIFRSVFFTSALVLIAGLLLVFDVLHVFFESHLKTELASEASYIEYAIKDNRDSFFRKNKDSEKRITLILPDGKVLADTSIDAESLENHSDRPEFKSAVESGSGTSVRYSKTLTEKTIYYAKRLDDGSVLRVSATQYSAVTILLGLLQPVLVTVFICLVISLIISSRISRSIVKPINDINLENPEECEAYEELTPFLSKIAVQNRTISNQIAESNRMREEFRLITENMNEGFLVIDKDAKLLSCNTSALFLLDSEKTDGNVFTLNRSESFISAVKTALAGKRSENTMHHGDRTYSLIANPVMTNGAAAGAVIVIIDITESAEREAMRREFTANVSHELKTPLTSISGFAELMKAGGLPDSTVVDFSSSVYSEAQRLSSLVSDIIKLSELDECDIPLDSENVSLLELSREIAERLEPYAEKKNISLSVSGDDAEVFGVRRILDEMIYNLLDNAVKYGKDGGHADITVKETASCVSLSVSDDGIGIPNSAKERVFERFYRVDKNRSKEVGGTGLGLSIVKHAALFHKASVSLDSVLGHGTTVTVSFPHRKNA
mgnify:CR=1 FL=1